MIEATPSTSDEIADWIELVVLANDKKGTPLQQIQAWAKEWCHLEEHAVAMAFQVIKRRKSILAGNYPFSINELAIIKDSEIINCAYTLFLFLTRNSWELPWQNALPSKAEVEIFEDLTARVMSNYLNGNGKAIPFGWPSRYGRPQEFHLAINWLADKMHLTLGQAFRPPRRKDGGVDIIAWLPFPDNRTGFPIYLVQCTLQQNVLMKSRDIDLRLWSGWLEMDRDPMVILAIPGTIPTGELWNEISANSLIMDRFRLSQYSPPQLLDKELDFISNRLLVLSRTAQGLPHA
jgi:hypothetical protein